MRIAFGSIFTKPSTDNNESTDKQPKRLPVAEVTDYMLPPPKSLMGRFKTWWQDKTDHRTVLEKISLQERQSFEDRYGVNLPPSSAASQTPDNHESTPPALTNKKHYQPEEEIFTPERIQQLEDRHVVKNPSHPENYYKWFPRAGAASPPVLMLSPKVPEESQKQNPPSRLIRENGAFHLQVPDGNGQYVVPDEGSIPNFRTTGSIEDKPPSARGNVTSAPDAPLTLTPPFNYPKADLLVIPGGGALTPPEPPTIRVLEQVAPSVSVVSDIPFDSLLPNPIKSINSSGDVKYDFPLSAIDKLNNISRAFWDDISCEKMQDVQTSSDGRQVSFHLDGAKYTITEDPDQRLSVSRHSDDGKESSLSMSIPSRANNFRAPSYIIQSTDGFKTALLMTKDPLKSPEEKRAYHEFRESFGRTLRKMLEKASALSENPILITVPSIFPGDPHKIKDYFPIKRAAFE